MTRTPDIWGDTPPASGRAAATPVAVPPRVDAASFKGAFRRYPAGVSIITGLSCENPVGILVSSLTSVSAEPAIVGLSISDLSQAGQAVLRSERVVVHLLAGPDQELAEAFAMKPRPPIDWRRDALGRPVLATHGARLGGRIRHTTHAGTATLVSVDIEDVTPADAGADEALVHFGRRWFRLGGS